MGWFLWPLSAQALLSEWNSSRSKSSATIAVSVQVIASPWRYRIRVGCWLEGEDFLKWKSLACCTIHSFSFCRQLQFHKLECSNVRADRGDEKRSLWGGGINVETCVKKGEPHHVLGEEHSTFRSGRCKAWDGPGIFGARKKASAWTTSPRKPRWVSQGPTWSDSLSSRTFSLDTLNPAHKPLLPAALHSWYSRHPSASVQFAGFSLKTVLFILTCPTLFSLQVFAQFSLFTKSYLSYAIYNFITLSHQLIHTYPIAFVYFFFPSHLASSNMLWTYTLHLLFIAFSSNGTQDLWEIIFCSLMYPKCPGLCIYKYIIFYM